MATVQELLTKRACLAQVGGRRRRSDADAPPFWNSGSYAFQLLSTSWAAFCGV